MRTARKSYSLTAISTMRTASMRRLGSTLQVPKMRPGYALQMSATSWHLARNSSRVISAVVGMVGCPTVAHPAAEKLSRPRSIPAAVILLTQCSVVTPPSKSGELFRNHRRMLGSIPSSDCRSLLGRLM